MTSTASSTTDVSRGIHKGGHDCREVQEASDAYNHMTLFSSSDGKDKALSDHNIQMAKCLKEVSRQAAKTLRIQSPLLVSKTIRGLSTIAKDGSLLIPTRFPREQFVHLQVCITAQYMFRRLSKDELTFIDIRDDMNNLAYLLEHVTSLDSIAALCLLREARTLVLVIAEIATHLEALSNVRITNWHGVAEFFELFEGSPGSHLPISNFIPKLRHLTQLKVLGYGGFGSLYKVHFGGTVVMACKLVAAKKLKRLKYACADKVAASMISSPYLTVYYSCFRTNLAFVTLMEYIRGVDAHKILKVSGRFPYQVTKYVSAQLCLATAYLHMKGLVHRDIKPSNMMISPSCRMKLLDYDTVKVCVGNYSNSITHTYVRRSIDEFVDGESSGTLSYIAPEVLKKVPYGRATDWWSVGVTCLEMASGRGPFRAASEDKLRDKIKKGRYESNDRIEPHLNALISRFLVVNPIDRLTGTFFNEIRDHPYFRGMSWNQLDSLSPSMGNCPEFSQVKDLMVPGQDGRYSPPEEVLRARKGRCIIQLNKIRDCRNQVNLLTYYTDGFANILADLESGLPLVDKEVPITYEHIEYNETPARYLFEHLDGTTEKTRTETTVTDESYSVADSNPEVAR